jgi:hypothetical protein
MEPKDKKQYQSPEIVFETDLETKAGTPNGQPVDDGFELFPGSND